MISLNEVLHRIRFNILTTNLSFYLNIVFLNYKLKK